MSIKKLIKCAAKVVKCFETAVKPETFSATGLNLSTNYHCQ